ncbi:hypothetical protein PC110_g13646 [Phytophthora cactorum]|uniref:CCHC-type domain-containing protein n=1 Tax=Phytophthora cactorum TaxID=29920 RepID=A0A329S2X4_9STRA|nr:hypothetical protein PC112_g19535 [Phytophthora cactorum]RAW30002.1 hypothetical protein PC110_g13646 [Phytophthora cactorum]
MTNVNDEAARDDASATTQEPVTNHERVATPAIAHWTPETTVELHDMMRGLAGKLERLEESQSKLEKKIAGNADANVPHKFEPVRTRMHINSLAGSPQTPYTATPPVQAAQGEPVTAATPQQQGGQGHAEAGRFPVKVVIHYPEARQKKLAIRSFDGKELYVGLGSGVFEVGSKLATLQGVVERVQDEHHASSSDEALHCAKGHETDVAGTWHALGQMACGGGADYLVLNNIVQYASVDLQTVLMAKVDGSRLNYLQQTEKLAQFAQYWELEPAKHRNLGKKVVSAGGECHTKEMRMCHECNQVGHLWAACPGRVEAAEMHWTLRW